MRKASIYFSLFFYSLILFNCSLEGDPKLASSNSLTSEKKFDHLWQTFYLHLDSNSSDSALYYADSIKVLATKSQNKKWLAKSNKAIGYIFGINGKTKESTFYYLMAAKIFNEIGDLKNLADTYSNIGAEFYNNQKYLNAISYYNKAQDIYHYEGSNSDKAMAFRGLALCYKKMKEFSKAEEYLELGKRNAENGRDFYNLGLIYNTWGMLKLEQKEYNKAYNKLLLTIHYADSLSGNNDLRAIATNNIGEALFQAGNLEEAKDWLKKSISEKNKLNDPILSQSSYLLLAEILLKENNHTEAITLLERSLQEIPPGTTHPSINESLTLINQALVKANNQATPAQLPEFNKKLLTYSQKLLSYNKNVSETKERLETISQQQDIQEAVETHALNEQIAAYEQRNTYMQYAFLIPVFFLICAVASVYLAMRRNREYKKLYKRIEETLNSSKQLRQMNKKS